MKEYIFKKKKYKGHDIMENLEYIMKVQQKNIYAIDFKPVRLNDEYGTRITF